MHAAARDDAFLLDDAQASRLWRAVLYVYLVYLFVTGGSSQERGWTDAVAQLLALPMLLITLVQLRLRGRFHMHSLGLAAIATVALFPWLQLLPLTDALWVMAPARAALEGDLLAAGVEAHSTTVTLTPAATLRSALSLLPALAMFMAVLNIDTRGQRGLLVLCVAMPIASLMLGFMQLGGPQDSFLNPYPQWAPSMGGTFANPNHQGTAMLIGLAICLSFAMGPIGSAERERQVKRNPWPATIAGITLLLGLPLTNSRAAVVIGILLLAVASLLMVAGTLRKDGLGRGGRVALLSMIAFAALALFAATGWMRVDEVDEIRWLMREATFRLGGLHLPWGSGIGSFVPVFQQEMPTSLLMEKYINAAHNDFSQVWLEAGLGAIAVASVGAAAICVAVTKHIRMQRGDRRVVWAGMLTICVFLAHASVDYALRTPALTTVAVILIGALFVQSTREAADCCD